MFGSSTNSECGSCTMKPTAWVRFRRREIAVRRPETVDAAVRERARSDRGGARPAGPRTVQTLPIATEQTPPAGAGLAPLADTRRRPTVALWREPTVQSNRSLLAESGGMR